MIEIAQRLKSIKPSPTMAVTAKAAELKRAGKDVIGLAVGEPDFDTPDHIKKAAVEAIARGETKYTDASGTPEMKKAVMHKLKRDNNLEYAIDQVTVGNGAKQVIFNAFLATLNPGDEVIIPSPYWVSYPDMVMIAEGSPVFVTCPESNGFKLTAQDLDRAITKKTRWVILNSPSNPTGAVYSKAELRALADVLLKHPHVAVVTDDVYEYLIYDDTQPFITLLEVEPKLFERVLTVNGISKAYSMTGWRIGYAGGPKDLIKQIGSIQSHSTSNPCSISQAAAIVALTSENDFLKSWCPAFKKRRDFLYEAINAIEGLSCIKPPGAFFIFANCSALFGHKTPSGAVIKDSVDFTGYLLDEALVGTVAGSAFGMEGYFRLSYAVSEETLAKACERIAAACAKLELASGTKRSA